MKFNCGFLCLIIAVAGQKSFAGGGSAKYLRTNANFTCEKQGVFVKAEADKDPKPNQNRPHAFPKDGDLPSLPPFASKWHYLNDRKANLKFFTQSGVPILELHFLDTNKTRTVTFSQCSQGTISNYFDSTGKLVSYRQQDTASLDLYAFLIDCRVAKDELGKIVDTSGFDVTEQNDLGFKGFAIDWNRKAYVSFNHGSLGGGDLSFAAMIADKENSRNIRLTANVGVFGSNGMICHYDDEKAGN